MNKQPIPRALAAALYQIGALDFVEYCMLMHKLGVKKLVLY